MATAASPTPMGGAGPTRRMSQRQQALRQPPSRSAFTRSESQQASSFQARNNPKQFNDDSSEDEIPVPMKLSALTKALLNDGEPESSQPAERPPSPPRTRRRISQLNASTSSVFERGRHLRSTSEKPEDKNSRASSRDRGASPVTRKRVVRLSNTPQSLSQIQPSKRRSSSFSRSTQRHQQTSRPSSREKSADEKPEPQADINTPAHGNRIVRISTNSSGNRSRMGSTGLSSGRSFDRSVVDKSAGEMDYEQEEIPQTVARDTALAASYGSVSRYNSAVRGRLDDNANPQSSMRVKRVGKIPGTFLSGPARRGRRRQSDEDAGEEGEMDQYNPQHEQDNNVVDDMPDVAYYPVGIRDFNSGSPVSASASARALHRRHLSSMDSRSGSGSGSGRPSPRGIELESEPQRYPPLQRENEEAEEEEEIPYRKSVLRAELPSAHDQENDAHRSYKRSKSSFDDGMPPPRPMSVDPIPVRPTSPERKPLAPVANNTPQRPAPPPPPKMSVMEAATSTTGAAAAAASTKHRRNVLRVNGKTYTRLDCLGRGGSAKVYRVTAENGQMFALKRVALENADELTIRGYKGEIDLLGKLEGVDRVINLYAYEMNTEKQVLSLVMEMGERDLNALLASRQSPETSRFDPVFVRFYWKEMLECLAAVHQHDIVHSDLKPANFVLVKGRLKLIDFGIANAIQTDETVNVHRETQVGTPNYMSPESLLDSNNPRGGRLPGRPKLMKLGKSSDVWSLGCILYQMVYGMPPFGHIANQMARCQAIINWDHHIEFPSRGMGGAPVPPSLIRTLRRCLNRDHHMRPTCEELLYDSDPFLYPAEINSDKALPIDEELLGRIIQSVVSRCRERMPTESEVQLSGHRHTGTAYENQWQTGNNNTNVK